MLDSGAEGPGFKSQSRRCRVTVLGKLFTPIRASLHQAAKLVAALLRDVRVTAGRPGGNEFQPTAGFMTYVTCRLTAKNRCPLRKPTLDNRVRATFNFYCSRCHYQAAPHAHSAKMQPIATDVAWCVCRPQPLVRQKRSN